MKSIIYTTILLAGAMAFALSLGCDDGGGTDPAPEDTTPTPEDTEPATDTDPGEDGEPVVLVEFKGAVEGFGMDGNLVANAKVEIFDNATGKGTGVTVTADADGYVVFADLEKGKLYGFKAVLENYKDTFVWNVEAGKYDEETLWIVPNTVYQMALGLAGLTQDAGKSVVAGAVYWYDGAGDENSVGCGTVATESGDGDVRYMEAEGGLPTTIANQAFTACAGTEGDGRFVVANIPAGQATLIATSEAGDVIGATTMWSIADTIAVSNIYATDDVAANPTGACCD